MDSLPSVIATTCVVLLYNRIVYFVCDSRASEPLQNGFMKVVSDNEEKFILMCEDEPGNVIGSVFAGSEWILTEVWKRARKELGFGANILQVAEAFSKHLSQVYKSESWTEQDSFVEIIIAKGGEHGAIYTVGVETDVDENGNTPDPSEPKPIKVEECYASIGIGSSFVEGVIGGFLQDRSNQMVHHNQVEKPSEQVEEPAEQVEGPAEQVEPAEKVEEPAEKVEVADVDHEVVYTLERAMLSACCGDPYTGGYIKFRYAGHQIYNSVPTMHPLDLYKKHYYDDVIKNPTRSGKLEMFVFTTTVGDVWRCFSSKAKGCDRDYAILGFIRGYVMHSFWLTPEVFQRKMGTARDNAAGCDDEVLGTLQFGYFYPRKSKGSKRRKTPNPAREGPHYFCPSSYEVLEKLVPEGHDKDVFGFSPDYRGKPSSSDPAGSSNSRVKH